MVLSCSLTIHVASTLFVVQGLMRNSTKITVICCLKPVGLYPAKFLAVSPEREGQNFVTFFILRHFFSLVIFPTVGSNPLLEIASTTLDNFPVEISWKICRFAAFAIFLFSLLF